MRFCSRFLSVAEKIYSDYSGCGNLTSSLSSASEVESAGLSVQQNFGMLVAYGRR